MGTLYSLKHSHTHNVLCYPIRCCAIQLERLISERFHFLLLKFFCFLTLLRVEQKKFTSRGIEKPDPKLNIFVISERAYPAHLHLLYTCSCICCFVISIDQRY